MKKNNKKYLIYTLITLSILAILGGVFSVSQPSYEVDSMGNLVIKQKGVYSIFSVTGSSCKVRDDAFIYCSDGKVGRALYKDFYGTGQSVWDYNAAGSCAGWMDYFGCNPKECEYVDNGICSGSVSDNMAECDVDSDCGDGLCSSGICVSADQRACSGYVYRCVDGQVFKCVNGKLSSYIRCDMVHGISECSDTRTADSYKTVCKAGCTQNSDCPSGKACLYNKCIDKDVQEDITARIDVIEDLKRQGIECEQKGAGYTWTGTECIYNEPSVGSDVEPSAKPDEETIPEDVIVDCADGSQITYAIWDISVNDYKIVGECPEVSCTDDTDCAMNYICNDENICDRNTAVTLSDVVSICKDYESINEGGNCVLDTGKWLTLNLYYIISGGILIIGGIIYLAMRKSGRKKKK